MRSWRSDANPPKYPLTRNLRIGLGEVAAYQVLLVFQTAFKLIKVFLGMRTNLGASTRLHNRLDLLPILTVKLESCISPVSYLRGTSSATLHTTDRFAFPHCSSRSAVTRLDSNSACVPAI